MSAPNHPTSTPRLSSRTIRIALLLSLITGATFLSSTSFASVIVQRLFASATAIVSSGQAPETHAAAANQALSPEAATAMSAERRGHTATRLSDGRVLIAGGDNSGGGYSNTAEIFDPVSGTFSVVGSMALGRADHAAVKLADGKVLIMGGRTAIGTTNTTEVFDPTTGTFSGGPNMSVARASHSATLFADGRVFVAGGDGNGSAEILDSGSFSSVGANLATARAKHSAALLLDGRVLIVGGRDTNGTDLSSMEIFDPADQSFSSAGDLTMTRVLPHLRVLFDGKVQIIGGNNDESMEIYDPVTRELGAYAHVLPATDTCTGLRPGILASQTRAALFHNGQSDALLDRSGHTMNELPGSNQALVAGGANSSGIVLDSISMLASSPSSITTEKLDYAPGETVNISGRGWQPGETVRVKIHEDPHTPQERGFDIVADANGSFVGTYLVQDYDLSMKFIVSARGLTSGWSAQTTFTDANNDAHVAPGWAATNSTVTFNTLYRVTTTGTVQHVRITLPTGYTGISVTATAFSSGTWSAPVVNQVNRTIDVSLTSGTGLTSAANGWARIDVTATTPAANQSGNAAEWLMETFTNAAGTGAANQDDNPPVLIGNTTSPSATITFVDAGGVPIVSPVLQNGVAATVRVRVTQTGSGVKYTDVAVPTCFSSPSGVTTTVSTGGNGGYAPIVTDGFIRLPSGSIPTNGFLTVQFTTTPNCSSGTYVVSSDPATNATNPPSGTNQSVSTTGGSLTVAAGLADLSISKTDSPDPVTVGGTLTYTIGVNNAGPDDASAVKVVDTLPSGVTFVSATGTNWTCNNVSGTVTCNRTGGNLPPGAAPNITIVVTAPGTPGSITNTATVSSPNDNTPGNNTATATTTVAAANVAPVAASQSVTTNEDTAKTITLSSSDADGNTQTFSIVSGPTNGSLGAIGTPTCTGGTPKTCTADVVYTPNANYNGPDSFTFKTNDGTLDSNTATVSITVNSVNDAPAGTNNTVTTNEDTTYTFTTGDFGFTDPNDTPANTLSAVKITTVATNGKLKLNGVDVTAGQSVLVADINSGKLQFFPDANENGTPYATFTFQVQDDGGTANGGVDLDQSANTMTVNVNSVNDEPAGANKTVTTNEDTAYTFAAAEFGFTDPNDTPANSLSAVKITTVATDGKLKLGGVDVTPGQFIAVADINAGNLKFFPDANENGSPYATFTFQVQDDGGTANGGVDLDQSPNTMTVNVLAVNDEPAGADKTVTTNEDATYTFNTGDFGFTDPNDTPANAFAAVKITTVASDGKLKLSGVDVTAGQLILVADINAGNLKFFPDTNESGSPYATFTFQVQDDGGTANGGVDLDQSANTMTVNVTAVNDEPAGTDNAVTTNEDTAHTFTAAEFGFTDPNDTPANALAAVKITSVATDGKLKLNGVDVTPGQLIPVAAINAGNLKFFPDANESGSPYATFTFQVQDDGGTANGGVDLDQSANTMTVNVTAVNDEPVGTDNSVTTNEDTVHTFTTAEFGFSDPNDTPANTLAAVKITTVATDGKLKLSGVDVTPGQFILVADITAGNLMFFPDANENGTPYATFTFQVQDNGGTANGGVDLDQSPNTMTINVTAVNDTPDAVDDSATVDEDSTNNAINVLTNDTDPDNLTPPANAGLTVIAVTQGTHGSVTFTATGVSYTPNANYFGTDSFTYTISDNGTSDAGHADTATVNVTINNVNDAPDAIDDSATVDEDTTNNAINVLANDTDPDNLTAPFNAGLTVIAVTQGTHGSVTFTAGGVSYTPNANYFGTDSFTYTISDNGTSDAGHTDTATVNVTINNVNDAPDAVDDSATVDEDSTNNAVNVLANDTDPDNLTPPANAGLTVIAVTQGTHGSVTFTATGVSYTPAANYFGSDSFTYTISDNGTSDAGHTDTATVNVTINNVNDAPDAVDDSATVDEDTSNNAINVLANDTDADNLTPPANAGLTVIAVTQGTHGSVTFTAGGVSYTPNANYFGSDSFTYTISDNGTSDAGHTDTATVNVTINNVNDAPDAVDDSATMDEDTTNNAINVLANDTDPDNLTAPFNAGLTVIAVTQGTHGSVTFTAGGVSYTPNANYFGSDSFTYTISDNGTSDAGHIDTATVNVTINNVNDAPDAVDDAATVDEDTSNNAINVLANDTDADNLTAPFNAGLTVIAVTQGTHGSVTFTPTGVSYTPAPNYFGTDSFTYTISDNGTSDAGHIDTATVNVTINNVNDAPDAVDDSAAVDEDTTNNAINVLANDTDPDNLTAPFNAGLTVIAVTQGTHGSVTFTAGGVSYTPNANYFGTDSFTYTISDNGTSDAGHIDTATVNVTINNVNDAPDAVDDAATVDEDTSNNAINVLANDTDADNLTAPFNAGLTVIAVTQGTHGSVTFTAGGVSYTPNANYFGSDSFTYTISDNGTSDAGHIDTATVNVTINNVNDTPDAVDDSATVDEDTTNNAINVLANDTDADNLTAPFNAGLTVIAVTQGTHGSVTFTAGGVSYTPNANYFGSDSFTYTISDNGTSDPGHTDTATVNVTINNVNDAPDAVDDSATVDEDTSNNAINVLANDTDADNLTAPFNAGLTVIAVTQGTHGSVTFTATGVSYTPNANYFGTDSFTYTISDNGTSDAGHIDTATVNVTINNVNDAPDAVDDAATVDEDTSNNAINVLANDTDADNLTAPFNAGLTVIAVTQGTHGSVTFTAGGVSYTPNANYFGSDSFTYTISDNGTSDAGHIDTATVNVTINNVNDTPDAVDDSATVDEDTTNNAINVLANDTDADNLTAPFNAGLTVIAVTQGTHGSVTFTAGGVSYTPNANYFGTDSFTYTISDNGTSDAGHIDTATVNVTINNVNDAPDAVDDAATVDEDTSNNAINVLANDTDADNLTAPFNAGLTVIAVTQGTHGSVTFTATGISYTPNANYFGSDSFTYTISDNGTSDPGHTDTATVNVTINNVNDAPDAVDDAATVDEDTTNNAINVLANDTDPDNLTAPFNAGLTVIAVTQGTHGSVTFTAGGVSYTPNANYFGSDSFTYTISDNGTSDAGHIDTATVNVTINNVNDTPDAVDDSATVSEDSSNNAINVLANDTDPDNLTAPFNAGLTVVAVTQPTHGTAAFTSGGVTYTPAPNYFGPDSFTYAISDDGSMAAGHIDTATVNITVTNVNDMPDAVDDSATVNEDSSSNAINVLANDTDPDNLAAPFNAGLTVVAVTQPTHGTAAFTPTGVTYTPAPNYFGPDSFTYTISDGDGAMDTATVNITVTNINDTPDAVDDSATVNEDSSNNAIDVLANDTDPDNLSGPANAGLTVVAVTQPTHGSAAFTAGGVTYTPAANYFGPDSFTYTISDGDGAMDTATVNITVTNVNDTPDAVDDSATVSEDSSNNAIDVLANDTDADNQASPFNAGLTVIAVTQGTHGSVTFTAGGVSYTPNANYFGSDSFTYTISDNGTSDPGHTDTATVNVTVTNVNDAPDAVDDAATVSEDSSNNAINVLANDTDADNLTPPFNAGLTVIAVTQGAHGTVTFTAGGVSYTPASNYFGPDSFTYTISDNGTNTAGHTDTATVNVTVTNVNDAPIINTLTIAPGVINENDSAVLNGSFSDADGGDPHMVVISWGDGSPNTTLNLAAGVFTFTVNHQYKDDNPTNTASDVNTVMVSVCDGGQDGSLATSGDNACAGQNTTITVRNVAPVISSANGPTAPQPSGSPITVTANFTDVGTQDTHACSVNWDDGTTSNGTVTEANGSGMCTASHTYTSPGVYSIVVTVTDDDTGSTSRPIELQFVVIFDPNSGFVTGGGWIMSPAGACQLTPGCATLTGKANFGFVSKYKRGSNTPDGQTEFQFQAGDINFHSSAYDYGSLVVSGYKAQYKGTGDINGVPGYKFVLTAYDGDVNGGGGIDKFRMKITKNGVVVYDNRIGASDDIDLANPLAISGGSIVIHK